MGKQAQNAVHRIIGTERFRGWENQLRDEPVFRLLHERMQRFPFEHAAGGWGWDAVTILAAASAT